MAVIYTKSGKMEILPTDKKTYQGSGKNTKYSRKANNRRRKPYRGQGRR